MGRKSKNKRKEVKSKKPFKLSLFILVLFIFHVFLILFFHIFGSFYVKCHIPIFTKIVSLWLNVIEVTYADNNIICNVIYYVKDNNGNITPLKVAINTVGSLLYILPIIVYTLLIAWPLSLKEKCLLGVISGVLIEIFHILYICIHWIYQFILITKGSSLFCSLWERFFANNGGMQFVAIIIFFISLITVKFRW